MQNTRSSGIEVAIGPHPARPDWRVLRVSYAATPEHDARVVAAIDALYRPGPTQAAVEAGR